ncbi:MAG: helix-turn-helix domain-containing protein [Actinomycetota bacterium]|nr:helix-turn-helix domain-containing protein [Actinomycetota bacterium]
MSNWAGNLIRLARYEKGLSQRELARRARTSQSTLSAYEAGRKEPSLETLARIVRSAGLDLRIQLTASDDQDRSVRDFEAGLPDKVRTALSQRDLELINNARKERGLQPVGSDDLV